MSNTLLWRWGWFSLEINIWTVELLIDDKTRRIGKEEFTNNCVGAAWHWWLWCYTLQELLNILNLNCFLTLKYSRQKLAGVSMLCNGNHLFLQQSDPSVCILQIRLTLHIEMSSDWTFLAGFSVSTSSTLWHWTDKKNQKYFLLLVFYRVEQSQQQVECEYCSGILSALYLIYNILSPSTCNSGQQPSINQLYLTVPHKVQCSP